MSNSRILTRNQHTCFYCGGPADTIDHVRPKVAGDAQSHHNLVAACSICNNFKSHYRLVSEPDIVRLLSTVPDDAFTAAGLTPRHIVIAHGIDPLRELHNAIGAPPERHLLERVRRVYTHATLTVDDVLKPLRNGVPIDAQAVAWAMRIIALERSMPTWDGRIETFPLDAFRQPILAALPEPVLHNHVRAMTGIPDDNPRRLNRALSILQAAGYLTARDDDAYDLAPIPPTLTLSALRPLLEQPTPRRLPDSLSLPEDDLELAAWLFTLAPSFTLHQATEGADGRFAVTRLKRVLATLRQQRWIILDPPRGRGARYHVIAPSAALATLRRRQQHHQTDAPSNELAERLHDAITTALTTLVQSLQLTRTDISHTALNRRIRTAFQPIQVREALLGRIRDELGAHHVVKYRRKKGRKGRKATRKARFKGATPATIEKIAARLTTFITERHLLNPASDADS